MYFNELRTCRSRAFILILAIVVGQFIRPPVLRSQWIRANGPPGGYISVLFSNGTNLFAGTPNAAYLSTDLGANWTASDTIFSSGSNGLSCLTAASTLDGGEEIYAGTNDGVFFSSDNGASWQPISTPLLNTRILSIAAFPNDSGGMSVFAATGSDAVLSTDNGLTWSRADSSLTDRAVNVVTSAVGIEGAITVYAGTAIGRVFASYDSGRTWSLVDSGTAGNAVISIAGADSNILVGTAHGLFRLSDGGTSWVNADSGLADSVVSLIAVCGNASYAGTPRGLFKSTDGGKFWTSFNKGLWNESITALSVDSSSPGLVVGTPAGVFYSGTDSANWVAIGLPVSGVTSLSAWKNNLWAAADGGIFLSTDDGNTWTNTGYSSGPVDGVIALSDSVVIIGTDGNSIYRSTDKGLSWTPVKYTLSEINISFVQAGNDLYEASNGGLFRSSDSGKMWSNDLLFGGVTTVCVNDTTILAGTVSDGIYRSMDTCSTWASSGLQNVVIESIVAVKNESGEVTFFAATGTQGIYRSTDDGVNWEASGLQSTAPYAFCLYVVPSRGGGSNIFASTLYGGLFVSTDNGASWTAADSGMGRSGSDLVRTFALESNSLDSLYLFAGSVGVWRRPLFQMVAAVNTSNPTLPARFSLEQNYPNPFNPTTEIEFNIARRSAVHIVVYDVLGRQISVLVNEVKEPGSYTVLFNGSRFASGVYFCRMTAAGFSRVRKLMLIK